MIKPKDAFICVRNSCRSQMAEKIKQNEMKLHIGHH